MRFRFGRFCTFFSFFFVTAEKPKLAFWTSVAAGVTNVVLDALFIVVFDWGLAGAAAASALAQTVGGVLPLIYFGRKNDSLLKLTRPIFEVGSVVKCCTNGSSELTSIIAMSLAGVVYNIQALKYAGESGVAAFGVLIYVGTICGGVFWGYSSGVSPAISYHYGAGNYAELRNLRKKSYVVVGVVSASMLALSATFAHLIARIFAGYDAELLEMTRRGLIIYSFCYLFMGAAIFSSAFFTALNNGFISATIAFLRTFVFEIGAVLLLPLVLGIDGIWVSPVVAELAAAAVGVYFIAATRKKYRC